MTQENEMSEKQQDDGKPGFVESGGVLMEGHIRIFDPETGEDYVNKRS